MALTVNLIGPSPWGFRILGGRDFKKAITVSKVTGASKADQADLQPGDIILAINGKNTADMLNVEAQNTIKNSKTQLQLVVERYACRAWATREIIIYPKAPPKINVDAECKVFKPFITLLTQAVHYLCGKNALVMSQLLSKTGPFTTSIGLYVDKGLQQSLHGHLSTLPDNFSSGDEPPAATLESEVYKMIQENKESRTAPRQSNTFKMLQEVLEADEKEAAQKFPGLLSPNSPIQSVGGVKKNHTCEKCGTGILTLAVRIADDRYRHSECYTCTDCGLNLKMRGHFCVGDVMYCEKHAKQRYQGPGSSPQATVSPRQ
uniref:PDZ and LIM domain protein 2 n=1 Tax=Gasterosteus aculeatus TaxID=69293 RepID=G3PAJ9_GASAC